MGINMSKRNLIVLIAVVVFAIGVFGVAGYFSDHQKITITVESGAEQTQTTISKTGSSDKKTIQYGQTFRMKKGNYHLETTGTDFVTLGTDIEIKDKDTTITLSPNYTTDKLNHLLKEQQKALRSTIVQAFPKVDRSYTVNPGKLYRTGQWYATFLVKTPPTGSVAYYDHYRIVLKKEGGTWKTVTSIPEISLSSKKYPDIPKDILIDVNNDFKHLDY